MFFQIITASATIILKDCRNIDGDYTIGKANIHDSENFKEKWR